jgi:hypothetical protein
VFSRTGVSVQPPPVYRYTLSFRGRAFLSLFCLIPSLGRGFPRSFLNREDSCVCFAELRAVCLLSLGCVFHTTMTCQPRVGAKTLYPPNKWDSSWNRVGAVGEKEIIRGQDPAQEVT